MGPRDACPSPRLGHLGCQHLPVLCSEDGTTVRVMKAYSSSLQPYPYFVLATLIIYLLMQVGTGGQGPWMTWSSLPVLPAWCQLGTHLCILDQVFSVDRGPVRQA